MFTPEINMIFCVICAWIKKFKKKKLKTRKNKKILFQTKIISLHHTILNSGHL